MKIPCELTINIQGELKLQLSKLPDDMASFLADVDFEMIEGDSQGKLTWLLKPHRPVEVRFNEDKSEAYIEYLDVEAPKSTVTPTMTADYWLNNKAWC